MFRTLFSTILFAIVKAMALVINNQRGSVATDIVLPIGEVNFRSDGDLVESGRLDSTYAIKNIYAKIDYPFNDYDGSTGSTAKSALFLYGRTTPQGDATYASAPIGSRFDLLTISSNVVTQYDMFIKKWSGAYGWAKVMLGFDSTSATTLTAAGELGRMWGQTSATSGIFRGLSVRTLFTGAGTATGDALRAYNVTNVSIANMHGIHSTAQLGAEDAASVGTVTGQAAGVRATIGIGLTNTAPAGGTLASLRCDSYFLSTAASAASSFIYMCDVGDSYGVDAIIRIGDLVNRSTSKNTGSYQYIAGHQTPGNCDGSLKVVTPDGTFYIPLYASFS